MNTTATDLLLSCINMNFLSLLVKSISPKNKSGFALYGNPPRWHKMSVDKPIPKGAPVAAHPHAAGVPVPVKHFSDDEWSQLHLPDSNVNASTHNKQVQKLKEHSEAGDVTAILGSSYGSNNYAKKIVITANHLLKLHGSPHQVALGQKAGEHDAVQNAPLSKDEAISEAIDHLTEDSKQADMSAKEKAEYAALIAKLKTAQDSSPKDGDTKPASDGGVLTFKDGYWHQSKETTFSDLPDYAQDLYAAAEKQPVINATGLIECHVAAADMVDAISSGDVVIPAGVPVLAYNYDELKGEEFNQNLKNTPPPSVTSEGASFLLEDLLDQSINGHSFLKVGDHFIDPSLKSGNASQHEIDKVGAYLVKVFDKSGIKPVAVVKKEATKPSDSLSATNKLSLIPWDKQYLPDSNSNAATHNKAVTKIKTMADAGDVAGLKAFVDSKANAKQTYAKKQGLLAATALAALTEGDDVPPPVAAPSAPVLNDKMTKLADTVSKVIDSSKSPTLPPIPKFSDYNYEIVAKKWQSFAGDGHGVELGTSINKFVETIKKTPSMGDNPDVQSLVLYALALTKWNKANPVTATAPAPKSDNEPQWETFHNTSDGHNKFWSVAVVGNKIHKHYGAIGTKGQKLVSEYASPEAAKKQAAKEKATKKSNGYDAVSTPVLSYPLKPLFTIPHLSAAVNYAEDLLKDKDLKALTQLKLAWSSLSGRQIETVKKYIDDSVSFLGGDVTNQEDTPKDGDTKQGADGMLVFKNGRWHKQDQSKGDAILNKWAFDAALGKKPSFSDAVYVQHEYFDKDDMDSILDAIVDAVPDADYEDYDELLSNITKLHQQSISMTEQTESKAGLDEIVVPSYGAFSDKSAEQSKINSQFTEQSEGLLAYTKKHGAAGLYKFVTVNPDGSIVVDSKDGFKVTLNDFSDSFVDLKQPKYARLNAMYHFVKHLIDAVPALPATVESMDDWVKTGEQQGSNVGGKFKDETGQEWYCKFPSHEDIARSEVLASKLYQLAGVAGQDAKLVSKDGKIGVASRWVSVTKAEPSKLKKTEGVLSGFAVDAWLANWDVVGAGYDNLQVGADGKAVRVDAGGSLNYRAQGAKKQFGDAVIEIDSMRDKDVNPQAAAVFGLMTVADITASVSKVASLKDEDIKSLVDSYAGGTDESKAALYNTLIARKADLLAKYPKAAKQPKKKLDPSKLPVKESDLPSTHDYSNWNGEGSGLSSHDIINKANEQVEQQIKAIALSGNLLALQGFRFNKIDKGSGKSTGETEAITDHPSKHVVQYYLDTLSALEEIANPPTPLEITKMIGVGSLNKIMAAFPPKKFGTTINHVAASEKLGFWVALGGISGDVSKLRPPVNLAYSESAKKTAFKKFEQASKLAKHFINKVQASSAYNELFRLGHKVDSKGNSLADVAKAALEHSTTQPAGTTIYRWQSMTDDMVKKVLSVPDGTVIQATGPMCTSYDSTATSGFGQHRVVIRYADGARGVDSFGSGNFKGEKEVTTLPNNRFVVLSKKMVPDIEHAHSNGTRLELELLMLPPDLGL